MQYTFITSNLFCRGCGDKVVSVIAFYSGELSSKSRWSTKFLLSKNCHHSSVDLFARSILLPWGFESHAHHLRFYQLKSDLSYICAMLALYKERK